jgi:hypothetical protein
VNPIRSALRPLLLVVAALVIAIQPSLGGSLAAGIFVTIVAISVLVVVSAAVSAPLSVARQSRTRSALNELVPWTAQSDPNAGGHRRPRAPGRLLPAV